MSITFEGEVKRVERLITGLYSFDRAFRTFPTSVREVALGYPIGYATEIFGPTGCGKTSFTLWLAGKLAVRTGGHISLLDLEGFDIELAMSILACTDFDGFVRLVQEDSDEGNLDKLIKNLKDAKAKNTVGILDSIGAISPLGEAEGEIGEANMGQRAKAMAQFTRKSLPILGKNTSILMVNHVHQIIGGRGTLTSGGEVLKYLSSTRIRLSRKEEFDDGSYVLEGKVVKNRFGLKDKLFYLVILAGSGVHPGLTWMFDGIIEGKVKRERTIKIGDKSMGLLNKNVLVAAHAGDDDFFLPFKEALYSNPPLEKELVDTADDS